MLVYEKNILKIQQINHQRKSLLNLSNDFNTPRLILTQNHFIISAINLEPKYPKMRLFTLLQSDESSSSLLRQGFKVPFGGNYRLIAGLSSIDIHPVCSIIPAGIIQGKQPGGVRERESLTGSGEGRWSDADVSQG